MDGPASSLDSVCSGGRFHTRQLWGFAGKPGTGTEARSSLARVTSPVVSDRRQAPAGRRQSRVRASTCTRRCAASRGNLVYAPASISIALAMLYGGAAGTTATEIAQAMHFGLPPERLHPAFDALDLALTAPPGRCVGVSACRSRTPPGASRSTTSSCRPIWICWRRAMAPGMRLVDFATPEPGPPADQPVGGRQHAAADHRSDSRRGDLSPRRGWC